MNETQKKAAKHLNTLGYCYVRDFAPGLGFYQHPNGLQVLLLTHPDVGFSYLTPVSQALDIQKNLDAVTRYTEQPDALGDAIDLLAEAGFHMGESSNAEKEALFGRIQEFLRPFGRAEDGYGEGAEAEELRSEQDTPEIGEAVKEAFWKYIVRENLVGLIDVFFEHGQWWARIQFDQEQFPDADERTFSVMDAEGGDSIDGFDFEEV